MKVLIVDDHFVVREGLRRLLLTLPNIEIHEAETARKAVAAFRAFRPHVIVLDISLPDASGFDLLVRLKAEDKDARVVMFTMHSEPGYASRALRAGAAGYVSKSAAADELVTAIEKVASGEKYVSRELANELACAAARPADPVDSLSNRELEILRLLGAGRSLSQIAVTLGVAYKTVANCSTRLKAKLGLSRTADLIRFSIEWRRGGREGDGGAVERP